jgi:hypothetical protein
MRVTFSLSPSFCVALLLGCSTESINPSGVRGDAGPVSAHKCEGPGYYQETPEVNVLHISATVVDEHGRPVPNMWAYACGTNVCIKGTTDTNGKVFIDTDSQQVKPAFKYGDGRTHAKFALLLAGDQPVNIDLGEQRTVTYARAASDDVLTPGSTASSAGVELRLAADANPVEPDPFDYDTDDRRMFRAAAVPTQNLPAAVPTSLGFGMLFALTPSGTELCPPAALTVPNSANYPAGSLVEIFLHGTDILESWAPYGGWAKVSDGVVSEDGNTVSTVEGGGLPALSVIGIRLAQ